MKFTEKMAFGVLVSVLMNWVRGRVSRATVFSGVVVFMVGVAAAAEPENVLQRLEHQESWRTQALRDYEGMRRYVLTGDRFGQNAAMGVRVNYVYPGRKNLEVVWESGSRLLQSRVLRRVIEAELEADGDQFRDQVRVTSQNYTFRPAGVESIKGRRAYVFQLEPKKNNKYCIRGRAWVDAEDAAIVRLEGEPVSAHSFWVRGIHIVQEFQKIGGFWLLAATRTDADVRFFGPAHLRIDYTDYQVNRSMMANLGRPLVRP